MKKLVAIIALLLSLALVFGACGSPADTPSAPAKAENQSTGESSSTAEEITVAGVVFLEDQFMKLLQMGYEVAAQEEGVTLMASNTNNDQSKENEMISTYVAQEIDGIAISPINETTSMEVLKKASETGIKVAVCNTALQDNAFAVGGFTSDNYNIGEQTGIECARFIQENYSADETVNIAIVRYQALLPQQSEERYNGFIDQVKDLPNVEIVADQDAWMQDTAIQVAGDILTANEAKGGVDIIWAANDGGTLGSVMAVKNAGKEGQTFVFGTDAAEQQIKMLRDEDNVLQCVTGQNPYEIGYQTMKLLIQKIKAGDDTSEKETIVPGITLTRDNPESIDAFEKDLLERSK